MTTFARTPIGLGIHNPEGIKHLYGGTTRAAIAAELDWFTEQLALDQGKVWPSTSAYRLAPAGYGLWMRLGHAVDGLAVNILYELKSRGITPNVSLELDRAHPVWDREHAYLGAPTRPGSDYPAAAPTLATRTPTYADGSAIGGELLDWDPTAPERNVYQRILDGDYDVWIDAFAQSLKAMIGLTADPDDAGTSPKQTRKGTVWENEERIIVRPAFEVNGSMPWSVRADFSQDDRALRYRSRDEFMYAWCYLSDRIRHHGGASNAHLFLCYVLVADSRVNGGHNDGAFRHNQYNFYRPRFRTSRRKPGGRCRLDRTATVFTPSLGTMNANTQFVGFDTYDWDGDGLRAGRKDADGWRNLFSLPPIRASAQRIFKTTGDRKPMLIGEWGTAFRSRSDANDWGARHVNYTHSSRLPRQPPTAEWDDRCRHSGSSVKNDVCRGRWFYESLVGISRGRANWARAIKGFFYMNRDLPENARYGNDLYYDLDGTPNPNGVNGPLLQWNSWALYDGDDVAPSGSVSAASSQASLVNWADPVPRGVWEPPIGRGVGMSSEDFGLFRRWAHAANQRRFRAYNAPGRGGFFAT